MILDSLESYSYDLPEQLIAKYPVHPRNHARLMVLDRAKQAISHHYFWELTSLLAPTDHLIFNNTKVMLARIKGFRTKSFGDVSVQGGSVEVLLEQKVDATIYSGLMRFRKRVELGFSFAVPHTAGYLYGEVVQKNVSDGSVWVRWSEDPLLLEVGSVPIPPYMQREAHPSDLIDYQTVYAATLGSNAAPTAGLHFELECFEKLKAKGIGYDFVTLHVGQGTFRPVKVDHLADHVMHEESYYVPEDIFKRVCERQHACVAVGTTSVRALESSVLSGAGAWSSTQLFIRPGAFEFKMVDKLITNFHLPKSTLLMLVCAFAGRDFTMYAYDEAIKHGYRFYSYGDAMLIL